MNPTDCATIERTKERITETIQKIEGEIQQRKTGARHAEPKGNHASKFEIRYWRKAVFHTTSVRNGQRYTSPYYMAAFSHKGHRESLSLETDNKEVAAAKARDAFRYLKANDWTAWRKQYKHVTEKSVTVASIAEYLDAATPWIVADPKSIRQYAQSLRRVAAHIADIPLREKIGSIPLSLFTPQQHQPLVRRLHQKRQITRR